MHTHVEYSVTHRVNDGSLQNTKRNHDYYVRESVWNIFIQAQLYYRKLNKIRAKYVYTATSKGCNPYMTAIIS